MEIQYQDFLLAEFQSRRALNPNYSLRKFARDIGMSAPKLSQNLRGLCGISAARAKKIAAHLKIPDDKKKLFVTMVEAKHARSLMGKKRAAQELRQLRGKMDRLTIENFSLIRDWHHMAILEMMDIKGFRPVPQWIAARLGLNTEIVAEAVERLQQLGLVKIENGNWEQTPTNLELHSQVPSEVIRDHHKQLLNKSLAAIDQIPMNEREFSSLTFAMDHNRFDEIKHILREAQHKIVEIIQDGNKDSVYFLGIQLYPLIGCEL